MALGRRGKSRLVQAQKKNVGLISPLLDPLLGDDLTLPTSDSSDTEEAAGYRQPQLRGSAAAAEGGDKGKGKGKERQHISSRRSVEDVEKEENESERYSVGGDDLEQGEASGWRRVSARHGENDGEGGGAGVEHGATEDNGSSSTESSLGEPGERLTPLMGTNPAD